MFNVPCHKDVLYFFVASVSGDSGLYLVASKQQCCPHEEAGHCLCSGGHEEDGLIWGEQWSLREPWDVGSSRGHCSWRSWNHCGYRGLAKQLWQGHVTSPEPGDLKVIRKRIYLHRSSFRQMIWYQQLQFKSVRLNIWKGLLLTTLAYNLTRHWKRRPVLLGLTTWE